MSAQISVAEIAASNEISALIDVLHQSGQRLEELTAGEVDTVADAEGRTFLLRRAQDLLRHLQAAREAAILNALPAHIALLDPRGLIISVNETWREFGSANAFRGPGSEVGVNYLDVCDHVYGDDAADARQAAAGIRSVLDGELKTFSIEYACHSPTEQRWFLMAVTPLAEDRLNGAVVMHIDITQQKLAKIALRQSEARLHRAQVMAKLAHAITDEKGLFESWSDTLPQLLGITPAELPKTTQTWLLIVEPKDRALFRQKVLEATVSKLRVELEYRLRRPDGKLLHVRQTIEPLEGKGNGAASSRWFNTLQDVTAEQEIKEDLCASDLRFRQMADNIDDVFFLQNTDRPEILYVSPAYEKIWGRTCESLYANPTSWADSIHPDDADKPFSRSGEYASSDFDHEFRIVRPDGSLRWIHVREFPILDNAGNTYRTAGVCTDITQRQHATLELRESQRRFSDMLRNVNLLSVMVDRSGSITYCNEYLLHLTGWSQEETVGRNWFDLFIPHDDAKLRSFFAALLENGPETAHHENEILTRSGERRLIRWNNSLLRSVAGDVTGTASIGEDITDQKRAEVKITRLNRVSAVLSQVNALIVRVRDRGELFRESCRIAVQHGGFWTAWIGVADLETLKVCPIASAGMTQDLITLLERPSSRSADGVPIGCILRVIREGKAFFSNDVQDDRDIVFHEEHARLGTRSMAVLPLPISDGVAGVLALYSAELGFFDEGEVTLLTEVASNIAYAMDHIEKENKLDYLAHFDVLTALANRDLFLGRLAAHMRSAIENRHGLALFLVDLERFKNINDTLGRPAGDALLRQFAEWLTRITGFANLLARVGADQFAVVLPVLKKNGNVARLLEKRMDDLLDHPFSLSEGTFRVTAKVGVALAPADGADADTLFKNAEAALKKAKSSGDRYLFYQPGMTEKVAGRLAMENLLRRALANGEFVLHYQPKISLKSGKLTGTEALIRWNDPRTGLVGPGQFIPILEETGLIHEVGRWVLRKAIEDYLHWHTAGFDEVRVSVNVSPLQLRGRAFIDEIKQVIGIDPRAANGLELEITESVFIEDLKHSIATLEEIRAMGIKIAIDDFGTGFSSLSYLSKLPIDTLKIDRSFVCDMTGAPEGLALVSTIINLAHALSLSVVAEGVETEEQSRLLRLLNCDEMQGYFLSKPISCEVFQSAYMKTRGAETITDEALCVTGH